jgi:long-chain acyl-CoA synthetase
MLYEVLAKTASSFSDRPALAEGGRTLAYSELLNVVEGMSRHLGDFGLGAGQTVAVQTPNSIECVAALFALSKLGAVILSLDPALKHEEVERYCRRAGAGVLLRGSGECDQMPESGLRILPVPPAEALCSPRTVSVRGERARRPGPPSQTPRRRSDENLVLLLSSGTTGFPKIVPKSVAQAEATLQITSLALRYVKEDSILAVLPFFHSFGLFNMMLTAMAAGACLRVESFSPRRTAATVETERITVLPGSPFMFHILAETDFHRTPDLSSVRLAISAGSALSPAVARRFREKFGLAIAQSYGMTEIGPVSLARPEDFVPGSGWVGRPHHGVTVEIWDAAGNPVADGVQGEIAVKSPVNSTSYLDDPDASAVTFKKGYVLTGDIGYRNEAGHLFILGRRKPMLSVAGKKVSPAEVEACLRSHPRVADALVVGTKTPDGVSDSIKALVLPAGDVTILELQEFCGKSLAAFKVPREIVLVKNVAGGALKKRPSVAPETTEG